MRVSILAPIRNSPYARNLCHLLAQEQGIELTDVIVRTPWTYRRIRQELLRDGPRLIRKAYKKIALLDKLAQFIV